LLSSSFLRHYDETKTLATSQPHLWDIGPDGEQVPVNVTAIGGQTLERFNYDKIADLVARIPTLNVQVGGSGSGGQLTLRGVGSSNISAAFDSAVAFDFDGVQVSTMRIVQSAFFDIQQIEVLKGPQSLFFGKSASAGVISVKSANPTEELEFGGKVAYEFEEQGLTTEAYVSGPISDKIGFRLAARFNDINKLLVNSAPVENPKRGEQNINIRGTLQFDPTDTFNANLKLNYIQQKSDGALRNAVVDCGANGVADIINSGGGVDPGYACDTSGDVYYFPDQAAPLGLQVEQYDNHGGVSWGESKIFFGRLEMNWDVSDDVTLTSVTGYLDQDAQDQDNYSYGGVRDGESFGLGGGLTDHQLEQFTQELRVATNYDSPVNFMLGVFYESRKIEFNTNQYAVNIGIVAPDPVTGNTSDWYKRHLYDNEAVSIFGQVLWDMTDKLELSAGVRWTDEKKVNEIVVPYVHAFLSGGPAFIGSGFETGDIVFKDSNLSPEVTLSYQITDDVNVYGSYKTGFKSGGIDNSALPSASLLCFGEDDATDEERAECASALIYDSETAKGGEIGLKSQWLDRALTLNFSAFYYVFTDLQVQNFDSFAIQFATSNASELTTKGFDVDFNWATSVDGLSVYGALAYTHSSYTEDFDPNGNDDVDVNLRGRASARAPKWAGNIAVDYRTPVGNGLEFGMTANMQFSSSYFTNEDSLNDHVQDSYATFDLALSVGDPEDKWQFAVIGRNLADKRFVNTSGGRPFLISGVGDDQVFNLNRGRHIFVEGSFRF
jgi:iron complex outermembrane recepter protein